MMNTRNIKYPFLLALSIVFVTVSAFQVIHNWKIKENFNVKFIHPDAEGIFQKFTGDIDFDETNPQQAKFDVKVDVKSVETGNPMRNESIASENWLDAKTYPYVTFKANSATKVDSTWITKGVLEIRGIQKEATIPFSFKSKTTDAVFESSFKIKMIDYNLSDDPEETLTLHLKIPVTQ